MVESTELRGRRWVHDYEMLVDKYRLVSATERPLITQIREKESHSEIEALYAVRIEGERSIDSRL